MEKVKSVVAEVDRKHFVAIIVVIAVAMEWISLRKDLAYAQIVKSDIKNIDFMCISSKGVLEVHSNDYAKPFEFYANVDIAGLSNEKLESMMTIPILMNEAKPAQAKIADKFKESIRKAIKDPDYTKKILFSIPGLKKSRGGTEDKDKS